MTNTNSIYSTKVIKQPVGICCCGVVRCFCFARDELCISRRQSYVRHAAQLILSALFLLILSTAVYAKTSVSVESLAKGIAEYDYGKGSDSIRAVESYIKATDGAGKLKLQAALLDILRRKDVSLASKWHVCRILKNIGTEASIPVLAELLKMPETTGMAIYAMHSIPSKAKNKTLIAALSNTSGTQKIEIITALGKPGNYAALDSVSDLFNDSESAIIREAFQAVARIGGPKAARILLNSKPGIEMHDVWIDACLLCASNLGKLNREITEKLCLKFAGPDNKIHIRYASISELLKCGSPQASNMILKMIKSNSAESRNTAAKILVTNRDITVLDTLLSILPELQPGSQISAIEIFVDCSYRKALANISSLMDSENKSVSQSAIAAVGMLGNVSDAEHLLHRALKRQIPEKCPEFVALAKMNDPEIETKLIHHLKSPNPVKVNVCVNLLGQRNCKRAQSALLDLISVKKNPPIDSVSMALYRIGDESALPVLLELVLQEKESSWTTKTISAIAKRTDKAKCGNMIASALERANGKAKLTLLKLSGDSQADPCLPAIRNALTDSSADVRMAAASILINWYNAQPIDDVWTIANKPDTEAQGLLALRGYIRMIGLSAVTNEEKVSLCKKAFGLSKRVEEKRAILGQLQNIMSAQAFELVLPLLQYPELSAEAELALIKIASEGGKAVTDSIVAEDLQEAMRHIISTSSNADRIKLARKILEGN